MNLRTVKTYILSEEFEQFWTYKSATWAKKYLATWTRKAMYSKIQPIKNVAKTLRKKLRALSNQPDCDPLRCWLKSIINHLYWVAATSKGNSSQLKWEKFISIMNHVQNVHVDHGLEFKECLHGELGDHQQKAWLQGGLITLRY